MSKLNTLERVVADTVNRAGGEAYTETPEVALVNLLLTSFMKEKHFSDKVFDTMALLETDRRALVHEIEALEL